MLGQWRALREMGSYQGSLYNDRGDSAKREKLRIWEMLCLTWSNDRDAIELAYEDTAIGRSSSPSSNSREGRKNGPRGRCGHCYGDKEQTILYEVASILSV